MNMPKEKKKEIIFGIIILAFTAFYYIMTLQVKMKAEVINARTIPYVLCVMFAVLGVSQLVTAFKKKYEEVEEQEQSDSDMKTVIKSAFMILLYVAWFENVGFLIMTIVFLFSMFLILTPNEKKVNYPLYIIVSVAVSLFVYLGFRYGLDIMLPQGIITFI